MMMSFSQEAWLARGTAFDHAIRNPVDLLATFDRGCECPRVIRMPTDWWDSPSAVGCALGDGHQSSRVARRLTRNTLSAWGLMTLVADAEIIVGELVANAVTHAAPPADCNSVPETPSLRLLRRTGEIMCAVLDASDELPVVRPASASAEAGRGLQLVDELSDVWGWSPVAGRGKAVWAILFIRERLVRHAAGSLVRHGRPDTP